MKSLQNANPIVHAVNDKRPVSQTDFDDKFIDVIDEQEIFDMIRSLNDPEHPLTLEELNVVRRDHINIHDEDIVVEFTPTIPHCSMATLIGLSIRVKLLRSLPRQYKVRVIIRAGTHQSEHAVNKQLNDKERVAAALENQNLLTVVNQCLSIND